jgi:hypothetical protein
LEQDLGMPPRVGKSVISQPNSSLMNHHQTAVLQGISSFLNEDNSPTYDQSMLYASMKLELTSDKSNNDNQTDVIIQSPQYRSEAGMKNRQPRGHSLKLALPTEVQQREFQKIGA